MGAVAPLALEVEVHVEVGVLHVDVTTLRFHLGEDFRFFLAIAIATLTLLAILFVVATLALGLLVALIFRIGTTPLFLLAITFEL